MIAGLRREGIRLPDCRRSRRYADGSAFIVPYFLDRDFTGVISQNAV